MDIERLKLKNSCMPARHISSQSFDEILSDLGDDPAIPDPHGIRKPPPQQKTSPRPVSHDKKNPFTGPLDHFQLKNSLQELAGPIALFGALIAATFVFFMAYKSLTNESQNALEESQKQISDLKKEMLLITNQDG